MPEPPAAPARSFWSGTISFGLVSIPVDFYAAARGRQKAMKMVDAQGHPLGRQYTREQDGQPLSKDDIVRGYETDEGQMVVITDEEFESAAPETSRDIDLGAFVPLDQIPPSHFVRPYFLAPARRSGKAYSLLAATMERTGKVGIGRFVMRGHEYLVAIIAEGGILRAETLRYADELRTPDDIGLPAPAAAAKKAVEAFAREIDRLLEPRLDLHELEDREAEALQELARSKARKRRDVVDLSAPDEDEEAEPEGATVVDLVQLLRRSLAGAQAAPAPEPAPTPAQDASPSRPSDLAGKSRDELYRMASELDIQGRSKMKKAELAQAVAAASRAAA